MIDTLLRTPAVIHHVIGSTSDEEGQVSPEVVDVHTVCHVQPVRLGGLAAEMVRGELVTQQRWRAWFPADTTIGAADTITVDGVTRQVHGEAEHWAAPSGAHPHVAVELRAVS